MWLLKEDTLITCCTCQSITTLHDIDEVFKEPIETSSTRSFH